MGRDLLDDFSKEIDFLLRPLLLLAVAFEESQELVLEERGRLVEEDSGEELQIAGGLHEGGCTNWEISLLLAAA